MKQAHYTYPGIIAGIIGLLLLWAGSLFGLAFVVAALGLILLDV